MTNTQIRKQDIRRFFVHYTDERLAQLLAHAQDGKLAYRSCCCLIGIPTATHRLHGEGQYDYDKIYADGHHGHSRKVYGIVALAAEVAYYSIAATEANRRRILIPMIRAEMKRRSNLAEVAIETESPVCVSAQ